MLKQQTKLLLEKIPKDKLKSALLRLQTITKRTKIIIFSALGLVLLLVLTVLVSSLFRTGSDFVLQKETATTRKETKRPSRYASDPEVLSLEVEIENLKEELKSINFSDPALNPPILDFEVNFDK